MSAVMTWVLCLVADQQQPQQSGKALQRPNICIVDNFINGIHPGEQYPAACNKQDRFQHSGACCCVGKGLAASHSGEEDDRPTTFRQ